MGFQHLFWFFRHPEVYVLILPRFRLLSHVVEFNISSPLIRYYRIVWSIMSIGFLRFIVWAHHIYSVRIDTDSKVYFSAATIMIRIPTRVKVFTWCLNIIDNHVFCSVPLFWAALFIWLFTLRRVTGIVLSNASVDLILHDCYYVVAHFHYVLSIGATAGIIMGAYHYFPVMVGASAHRFLALIRTFLFCLGVNGIFGPMHSLGVERMPRRYVNYPTFMQAINEIIGYYLMCTMSSVILLFNSLKFFGLNLVSTPHGWSIESCYGHPVSWHTFVRNSKHCFFVLTTVGTYVFLGLTGATARGCVACIGLECMAIPECPPQMTELEALQAKRSEEMYKYLHPTAYEYTSHYPSGRPKGY